MLFRYPRKEVAMFSLRSLLLIVAIAAIGAAGLIYRTQIWASALVALTLGVVLFAVCRALLVPMGRHFWGSFAVIGFAYLAIVSLPPLSMLHYNLPTTQLITYALEKLQTPLQTPSPPRPIYTPGNPPAGTPVDNSTTLMCFGGPGGVPSPAAAPVVRVYTRDDLFLIATGGLSSEGFHREARSFLWSAQCLWCLLVAFAAGSAGSWLFRPDPEPSKIAPPLSAG
jgi:hypothetical protein